VVARVVRSTERVSTRTDASNVAVGAPCSLRRRLDAGERVVVIDRSLAYAFAPSLRWVMTGARRPQHGPALGALAATLAERGITFHPNQSVAAPGPAATAMSVRAAGDALPDAGRGSSSGVRLRRSWRR
jgi:hypothetical protein